MFVLFLINAPGSGRGIPGAIYVCGGEYQGQGTRAGDGGFRRGDGENTRENPYLCVIIEKRHYHEIPDRYPDV